MSCIYWLIIRGAKLLMSQVLGLEVLYAVVFNWYSLVLYLCSLVFNLFSPVFFYFYSLVFNLLTLVFNLYSPVFDLCCLVFLFPCI